MKRKIVTNCSVGFGVEWAINEARTTTLTVCDGGAAA